jgi:hypothetical protein
MKIITLPNGINHIALSFSGGGFRAATYCLGCCSYLYRLPYGKDTMFSKVRFISSVSGGSITALAMVSMLNQGKDFEAIYDHILTAITGEKLIKKAFEILESDQYWSDRPNKKRNLINSFSIAYDEELFSHATYKDLFNKTDGTNSVIDEICINTTEFNNGQNFRFGTRGMVGNTYLSLSKASRREDGDATDSPNNMDIIRKIRLGDILATSSCFPGGFEPLVFPRDFSWKTKTDELTWEHLGKVLNYKDHYSNEPVDLEVKLEMASFMDGGIDDNQGIYSFLRADDRKEKGYDYDLYFPCDVSSNYLAHPYRYPGERRDEIFTGTIQYWKNKFNLWKANVFWGTALILIMGTAFVTFTSAKSLGLLLIGLFFGIITTLLLLYCIASSYIKKIILAFASASSPTNEGTWQLIWSKYKDHLIKLPLSQLLNMIEARLSSVSLLTGTVFLKKIRRMSYDALFTGKRKSNVDNSGELNTDNDHEVQGGVIQNENQSWENHIGPTAIYLLSTKNDWMLQKIIKSQPWDHATSSISPEQPEKPLMDFLQPGELLRSYIDKATEIETTLWFDDYHVEAKAKENLLIAGGATMCFNLLLIVHRINSPQPEWEDLKNRLLADWERIKADPTYLL